MPQVVKLKRLSTKFWNFKPFVWGLSYIYHNDMTIFVRYFQRYAKIIIFIFSLYCFTVNHRKPKMQSNIAWASVYFLTSLLIVMPMAQKSKLTFILHKCIHSIYITPIHSVYFCYKALQPFYLSLIKILKLALQS